MIIYTTLQLDDREKNHLQRGLNGETVVYGFELAPSDQEKAFGEADVAFGSPEPHWVGESKVLRWLQLNSVGYDQYLGLDWADLNERLTVTNVAGLFGVAVAETALAGILALYRRVDTLLELQRTGAWIGAPLRRELRTLYGSKALVIGPGNIGSNIKKRLLAFDCSVVLMGQNEEEADIYTIDALDALLPEVDVVVCSVPETDQTRNLFDEARLERLKGSAVFVNVGRGSVVDDRALAARIEDGKLGGAVLDVTREEPLPADHPLWTCPNTILTQHTGGGNWDEQLRKIDIFLENYGRYREGRPLYNQVRIG